MMYTCHCDRRSCIWVMNVFMCMCCVVWCGVQLYVGYREGGGCPWEKEEEGHSDRKSALSE